MAETFTIGQKIAAKAADAAVAQLRPTSPLVGHGAAFALASARFNVDWRVLVAIAYAETELGTTGGASRIHNPFGLGPGISFNSWDDAILRAGQVVDGYGVDTVAQVGAKWAPLGASNDPSNLNSNWTRNVTAILTRLGGDPSNVHGRPDQSTGEALRTIPGDAAAAVSAVTSPLDAIGGLVERLVDPAWWVRVGLVVGGVGALGLGVVLIGKAVTGGEVG